MKLAIKNSPFVLYDVVGVTLVLAFASAGLWSLFVHLPDSKDRLRKAKGDLTELHQSLRLVEANLHQSNAELVKVEAEVDERGALPSSAPVDANLQAITRLIKQNEIDLINLNPIDEKNYPGLTELNYKIQCQSGFGEILQFLGDFESEPFWADLTSLKIIGSPNLQGAESPGHRAEFVVSLFATRSARESVARP